MVLEANGSKGKEGEAPVASETVAKSEFEKVMADNEKLKADLEDIRMEVLSPEYVSYLQAGGKDKPKEEAKQELKDDDIEKMSKKELLELATKRAREEIMKEAPSKFKEAFDEREKAQTARDIASFAKTHADFETFRPIMYGLSLDPKNADSNLQELYDAAKAHVTRIHTGTSEAEKEKARKASNEKPGSSSYSMDKDKVEQYKKMSTIDIGRETMEELKAELGPLPSA